MNSPHQNTIIKTENLTIGYSSKKQQIVITSNINITLQRGELVGLVGANGIGKTTLLRTLTKVQPPIKGSIFINELPINKITSIELSKHLSVVLTEQPASKNLSVFELVSLGRQPYTNWIGNLSTNDYSIIENALNLTNIQHLKNKKCFELSDGQLQKVMIARALAQDTNLIVLDEPTTHLDMYHKAYILKLLKKLVKNTNKTILFSSHEIDLAIQLCDKILVMTNSNVILGSPNDLISKGVFNQLFPEDLIVFDQKTRTFKVR